MSLTIESSDNVVTRFLAIFQVYSVQQHFSHLLYSSPFNNVHDYLYLIRLRLINLNMFPENLFLLENLAKEIIKLEKPSRRQKCTA